MKTFEVGQCYFMLSYFDERSEMPLIESYVYLGENLLPQDSGKSEMTWYFKHPDNYLATGNRLNEEDFPECLLVSEDTVELVLDLPLLIQQLRALQEKR